MTTTDTRSEWQRDIDNLKACACFKCGGAGKLGNAQDGNDGRQTIPKRWQTDCDKCKGTGYAF